MKSFRHNIAYALLWLYKRSFSVVFYAFGVRCRHTPSCSEYGAESVSRHGFWAGGWMTLARLSRCRPGGTFGEDPAPKDCPEVSFWMPWRYGRWRGGS